MSFDIDLFLGDANAEPLEGSVPLEVKFTPGNPYDIIVEVNVFEYIIEEVNDSLYIINEEPL
jgi:hypothetical protein